MKARRVPLHRAGFAIALAASACMAQAFEPGLPTNAAETARTLSRGEGFALPLGPWTAEGLPAREIEGDVEVRAWRIGGTDSTPRQILAPLRSQIEAEGYEIVFDCADSACGGFDFRFALEILPAPDMVIDLGDFRAMSAIRPAGDGRGEEALFALASRTSRTAYLQITHVAPGGTLQRRDAGEGRDQAQVPPGADPAAAVPGRGAPPPAAPSERVLPGTIGATLLAQGHAALEDLNFPTGSTELSDGDYASLLALAAFLSENPGARVTLVGHTDAEGSLEVNVGISRQRADAVRRRLVERYGADPAQLGAEGMGWLAPRASNLTEAGREANRRVEAVLTALTP
jgi:OOP family OmpA-OmpF porin